jgi:sulfur-oxidizing protein SoxY
MSMKRRNFLRNAVTASAAVGFGVAVTRGALAAWPSAGFEARKYDDTMKALFKGASVTESGDVKVLAPDIAENGAVVPVTVETTLKDVKSISIVVPENLRPLTAQFEMQPGAEGYVSTRIKMAKTSKVIAIVDAGGKLYSGAKEVKVTIGGCGG